jgi:hypothetical protein
MALDNSCDMLEAAVDAALAACSTGAAAPTAPTD